MTKEQEKKFIFVLDWYTSKYVKLLDVSSEIKDKLSAGDKVVYSSDEGNNTSAKLTIGTYLGFDITTDREGQFKRILEGDEKEFFEGQNMFALQLFPMFKRLFKDNFVGSIPITARFHIFSDQIYFYFYAEERYVFSDFVKNLRQEIGKNIFLFQVGARDMIRLSPGTDNIVGCNGINLCCKSMRPLPSVEMENLILQNLEGRDIERLKGRCGKLKCSIVHELDLYVQESKRFPQKGSKVEDKKCDICGICTSFNIMNNEVTIRTDDGDMYRISLYQVKK